MSESSEYETRLRRGSNHSFSPYVHRLTMMLTVAETPLFQRRASAIMSDHERMAVIDHLARNPTAGV